MAEKLDTLKERIKKIMADKNMNQATFADFIDVGRPNITHIMTGRDKSSQKVISRILLAFPEINSRWLLNGEGEMYRALPSRTQIQVDEAIKQYEQEEMQTSFLSQKDFSDQLEDNQKTVSMPEQMPTVGSSADVQSSPAVNESDSVLNNADTAPKAPSVTDTKRENTVISENKTQENSPIFQTTNNSMEDSDIQKVLAGKPSDSPSLECNIPKSQEKRIRKIVFFYEDRTFEEYYPSEF